MGNAPPFDTNDNKIVADTPGIVAGASGIVVNMSEIVDFCHKFMSDPDDTTGITSPGHVVIGDIIDVFSNLTSLFVAANPDNQFPNQSYFVDQVSFETQQSQDMVNAVFDAYFEWGVHMKLAANK